MNTLGSRIAGIVALAAGSLLTHGPSVRAETANTVVAEPLASATTIDEELDGSVVAVKALSAGSTIALASSVFAVVSPAQVTLTATVSGTALKGSVSFKSGSVVVGTATINKSTATLSVALPAAIHLLTAVFVATGGDIVSPPTVVVVENALTCG